MMNLTTLKFDTFRPVQTFDFTYFRCYYHMDSSCSTTWPAANKRLNSSNNDPASTKRFFWGTFEMELHFLWWNTWSRDIRKRCSPNWEENIFRNSIDRSDRELLGAFRHQSQWSSNIDYLQRDWNRWSGVYLQGRD